MRYVEARLDDFQREETYRSYVSKSLQLIPQNSFITASYNDLIHPSDDEIDNRTSDEIVDDIIMRAGLHFGE